MADQSDDSAGLASSFAPPRRGVLPRVLAGFAMALLAALAIGWFGREEIADNLIRDQLDQLGLDATYEIESIGPRRQVLANIVIGDPDHPDLTVERVEASLALSFPFVTIGRIRVVKPRLYGAFVGGKPSFGVLDKLLFEQPPDEPFALPDLDLVIEDGRALIEGDLGAVGIKLAGAGNLRDGFEGILAATAPRLTYGGCAAERATLYGTVTIEARRPGFSGPLRLAALACPQNRLSASRLALALDGRAERGFAGFSGSARLSGGALAVAGNRAGAIAGSLRLSWRAGDLTASYDLGLDRVETPQLALSSLAIDGSLRGREGLSRIEVEAEVGGEELRPGAEIEAVLASAARATGGTLAGPMIARARQSLAREARGGRLDASVTLRHSDQATSVSVPEARWRGGGGATLLALSRVRFVLTADGRPRFAGNFVTGGPGLPRISGRMEGSDGASDTALHLRMAEYRVESASLALPRLVARQAGEGYRFEGELLASGPIPGGSVERLSVPVEGSWSGGGRFALWNGCADLRFERLAFGNLDIARRGLRLCPAAGGPILGNDGGGFRLAALLPGLDLAGRVGETPLALRTGAFALNFPGASRVTDVNLRFGPADATTRLAFGEITLDTARGIGGTFAGGDAFLAATPIDVIGAAGAWRLANGGIRLDNASFRLRDRVVPGRFSPLVARNAELTFANGRIRANAALREPSSGRIVTSVEIVHDLGDGTGFADLAVDGLQFDNRLQPDTLTSLALGVVANVEGRVDGAGRIEWSPESLTSSGRFTTGGLDFAAAFGPVEGVSGTITFTDLLGMVTAPQQVLTIRRFNPGIEVDEGHLTYELRPGYEMVIHGGAWPFIGGVLILEPTTTRLTATRTRRYTLRLIAVDAAQFVQRMELANIAATGRFDGRVPLVFDEDGGRLEGGYLVSRPPGGNLAYVGALTYEDMNPIANFAFDALRSLDFTRMEIDLDGALAGEIVTRVRFDGIRQGSGARRNIVTKQIARLPIRFNVNIRAPFYKLITSIQTMYDPAFVADPRAVGLLDNQGRPVDNPELRQLPAVKREDLPEAEATIQTPDSEDEP